MIGLAVALAAPPMELFVEIPAAATQPVAFTAETETGELAWRDPLHQFRLGLGLGVAGVTVDNGALMVSGGLNLWSSAWEHTPETFGVAVWEEWLGVAWRWETARPEAVVKGWWEFGGAIYVQQVLPTWFPGILVATPGMWTAGGATFGVGAVRPQVGLRAGFVHPGATADGASSNTPDDFAWTWNAGRAYVLAQVGVAFRKPLSTATTFAPPP